MRMMGNADEEVRKLFVALDRFVKKPTKIGLLGGAAVMQYGVSRRTKDIDICFFDGFQLNNVQPFLARYTRKHHILVDYGLPARFVSYILHEDLFAHPADIPGLERSFLSKQQFKRLDVKMIIPKYMVLVKLEAAVTRATHYLDAKEIVRIAQVPLEELVAAYVEYRPELEMNRGYQQEFETFVRDAYGKPRWKLPMPRPTSNL